MALKTISGTCELTTSEFTPTATAPVIQNENGVTLLDIDLEESGVAYSIPGGATAFVKFVYEERGIDTAEVEMTAAAGNLSVELPLALTERSGSALAIVTLHEGDDLIVACTIPIPVRAGGINYGT